ncbi:MAG: single-stranded DNA-binding protein [Desulforegulaceae bacterium]|nr:single-stranded DNA-binding protein [Desulforegulaceae bacterium]
MSGVNKAILLGNLGRDPEMRYTQDGNPMCSFSIATSETWKDKITGEKREKTEWHKIVVFKGLAEVCAKYLKKGSKVYIEGKIQTRSYEKNGATHYITEIVANDLNMLDSASGNSGQYPPPQQQNNLGPDDSNNPFPQSSSDTDINPGSFPRQESLGEKDQDSKNFDDDIPF